MRISYHNWPALQILDPKRCADYIRKDEEHFFCAFNAQGNLTEAEAYKLEGMTYMEIYNGIYTDIENIYYISKPFIDALNKSGKTFLKMITQQEECERVQEDCAFIYDDILWVVARRPNNYIRLMRIKNEGCLFTSIIYRFRGDNTFESYMSTTDPETERNCIAIYYMLMMLKRYGKAEIEMLPKQKKIHSQVLKEKTLNETGMNVKVLDSRWFTTICRNEGFLVSGHFRLQPKKDENGEWTRELIYINTYAKKGYHRLAPVINIEKQE